MFSVLMILNGYLPRPHVRAFYDYLKVHRPRVFILMSVIWDVSLIIHDERFYYLQVVIEYVLKRLDMLPSMPTLTSLQVDL